jgi:integrase
MPPKLTSTRIENARPGQELRDPQCAGLLAIRNRTDALFQVQVRVGRRKRRVTLGRWPGMSLKDARAAAHDARNRALRTVDPAALGHAGTVEAVVDHYAEAHLAKLRSGHDAAAILRREFVSRLAGTYIVDVRREDIAAMYDGIVKDRPVMAQRALRIVHHMLEWADTRGMVSRNPATGLQRKLGGKKPERDRVLSLPEVATLWRSAGAVRPAWFGALVRALILTGARRGEVFQFEADQVDARWWTIPASATKSARAHRVWLSDLAQETLNDVTFPSSASWNRLKATLPALDRPWVLHDVRRTVATHMGEQVGVQPHVVERVLGHQPPGLRKVYQRGSYDAEASDAWSRWSDHVGRLVA